LNLKFKFELCLNKGEGVGNGKNLIISLGPNPFDEVYRTSLASQPAEPFGPSPPAGPAPAYPSPFVTAMRGPPVSPLPCFLFLFLRPPVTASWGRGGRRKPRRPWLPPPPCWRPRMRATPPEIDPRRPSGAETLAGRPINPTAPATPSTAAAWGPGPVHC
jgi:hypothetical protein